MASFYSTTELARSLTQLWPRPAAATITTASPDWPTELQSAVMGELDGEAAFVTGGASGIGRAGAHALAGVGAQVMIADLNAGGAAEVAEEIRSAGGTAQSVGCDVTDEAAIQAALEATVQAFGGLTLAFNNAGNALGRARIHETDAADWRASIEVNLTSIFLCMKHELAWMMDHGGGCIVNTSSGAARVPAPGRAPYSAAKRGVVALTAQAARDYGSLGIRVNTVLPGVIDTPALRSNHDDEALDRLRRFLPSGRLGDSNEIADAVVWLCSPGSRYVNGQSLVVDGGGILA